MIPPERVLRPSREVRAPELNGVEDGVPPEVPEVLPAVVPGGVEEEAVFETMFEVTGVGVVTGVTIPVPLRLLDLEIEAVDDEELEELVVAAPIEKLALVAKTSVMLPMLTACKV